MNQMDPAEATSVARAIQSIGTGKGIPIRLAVPGVPFGTRHYAIVPDDDRAPVVTYRNMTVLEPGSWRVTSLMTRAAYDEYREAENSGILNDDTIKALLIIGGVIVAAYAISTIVNSRRRQSGLGADLMPREAEGDLGAVQSARRAAAVVRHFLVSFY
jgi:hypothetical protein